MKSNNSKVERRFGKRERYIENWTEKTREREGQKQGKIDRPMYEIMAVEGK